MLFRSVPTEGAVPQTETGKPVKEVDENTQDEKVDAAADEVKKFLKWLRKGNRKRPFNFEAIEADYAEVINKYLAIGDEESARWHAERYIGL